MVLKAVKLRLYPNDDQKLMLNQHFGNVRFVWNKFTKYEEIAYHIGWKHMNNYTLNKLLPKMKQKYDFLKLSDSTSLQCVSDNIEQTYKMFFKHQGGKPSFKRRSYNQSYTTKSTVKLISNHYVKLPKFKTPFRISKCHQPHGNIKRATIEMKSTGRYYLVLLCESTVKAKPLTHEVIGFDFGLRNNIILSNGTKIKAFKAYRLERQLKIAQRKLSRRIRLAKITVAQETHNNRKFGNSEKDVTPWYLRSGVVNARRQVARLHAKIKNKRYDFLQKLSTWLVSRYDVIVCENLNVKNMAKNHNLAHAIMMQGWSTLKAMLQYKCDWHHKELRLVDPKFTTQTCSDCGYRCSRKNGDHIEQDCHAWTCPQCGRHHDRDVNAAINILNCGL